MLLFLHCLVWLDHVSFGDFFCLYSLSDLLYNSWRDALIRAEVQASQSL